MRKVFFVFLALVLVAAMIVPAGTVFAAPGQVPPGSFLNAGDVPPRSKVILNITYSVTNDPDSGIGGNNWAYDNFNKTIQVWLTPDGSYYAVVKYAGKFTTIPGQVSPGATGVEGAIAGKGTMEGGYTATLAASAQFSPSSGSATHGNIGSFDYSDAPDWTALYFVDGSSFDYVNWGWTYHYKSQTWVNSASGNSGDIVVP